MVCSECIGCGQTRLCEQCPESKAAKEAAAAKEKAGLVCSPCMSEPACVPPEAAASVDNLLAIRQELSRAKDSIWKLEGLLKAALIDLQKATESIQLFLNVQKSLSAWQAASLSNEAPLLEEHAGAHVAPVVEKISVGSLD
jgi:hypothetical protein